MITKVVKMCCVCTVVCMQCIVMCGSTLYVCRLGA